MTVRFYFQHDGSIFCLHQSSGMDCETEVPNSKNNRNMTAPKGNNKRFGLHVNQQFLFVSPHFKIHIISSQSSPLPFWHSLYCYDPNCGSHVLVCSQKWLFNPFSDLSLTFQYKQYNICNIKFCLTKCYHQYFTENMYPVVHDHLAHILLLRSSFLSEQHNPYSIIFAKKVTQGHIINYDWRKI